jgi:Family of unknown function (DUF5675)
MIEMTLTRAQTSDEGTFGLLESEALEMHTGELPWKNNQRSVSCIPVGRYLCKAHRSPRHGQCFWLQDVPNRSEILIHSASWMGDTEKGFKSNLEGCIAIGMEFGKDIGPHDQDAILQSRVAMTKLIQYTEFQDFWLTIIDETGEGMKI